MSSHRRAALAAALVLVALAGRARADDIAVSARLDDRTPAPGKPALPDLIVTVVSGTSPPPVEHLSLVDPDASGGAVTVPAAEVKTYVQGDEPLGLAVVIETHHLWLGNRSWWPNPADATDGLYAPLTAALDQLAAAGPPGSKGALVTFGTGAATRWTGDLAELTGTAIGSQESLTSTVGSDGKRRQNVGLDVFPGVEEAYTDLQKMPVDRKVLLLIGDGNHSDGLGDLKKELAAAGIVVYAITIAEPTQALPGDPEGYKKLTRDARVIDTPESLHSAIGATVAAISDRYYVRFDGAELARRGVGVDGKPHAFLLRGASRADLELPDVVMPRFAPPAPARGPRWWLWGAIGGGTLCAVLALLVVTRKKPAPVVAPVAVAAPVAPPPPSPKLRTQFLDLWGEDEIPLVGWLVPLDGACAFRTFKLDERSNKIGTGGKSRIVLDDGYMSTEHCDITMSSDGFVIVDAGSVNGTVVNAQRVERHTLIDNDLITLGKTRVRFKSTR